MTANPPVLYPVAGSLGGSGGAIFADVSNFDSAHLRNLRAALANTVFGISDTIINDVGDSTDAGVIAIGSASAVYTNGRVQSTPALTAQYLNAIGIPAIMDNWFGDAAATTHSSGLNAYYPNVTLGSGWAVYEPTIGFVPGGYPVANSTTTNNLSTTCRSTADTATIFYITNGSTGTFTWQVGSGTVSSAISTVGSAGVGTLTVPLGTVASGQVLNIARASGTVYIVGVDFSNSTKKQVRFRNLGIGGSQTSDWVYTNYGWSIGNQMNKAAFAASLTFVNLGINDYINSLGASNTQANLSTLYSNILAAGGDLCSVVPIPSSTSAVSAATQAQYTSVIRALAASENIALFDANARFGSYASAVTQGFMGSGDNYHGTFAGYGDLARRRSQLILNAA